MPTYSPASILLQNCNVGDQIKAETVERSINEYHDLCHKACYVSLCIYFAEYYVVQVMQSVLRVCSDDNYGIDWPL